MFVIPKWMKNSISPYIQPNIQTIESRFQRAHYVDTCTPTIPTPQ